MDERKSFKKENINVILEFHVRIKVSIVTTELHIYIKYNLWLVALWRRAYQHTHEVTEIEKLKGSLYTEGNI